MATTLTDPIESVDAPANTAAPQADPDAALIAWAEQNLPATLTIEELIAAAQNLEV